MGKDSRRDLVDAVRDRYAAAPRAQRVRILDEFVALTGYHRKHAIRVLTSRSAASLPPRGTRHRLYGNTVVDALVVLWEASDRLCGKRLKAMLPPLVEALHQHGHLKLPEDVRHRVLSMSAATIDRLLRETRLQSQAKRRRRPVVSSALRRQVPVRTSADPPPTAPGWVEIDLVAHSGPSVAGSFVHTFTLTDVATGWTECVALVVREGSLVVEALKRLRPLLPFTLLGIDSDNGSEFLNEQLLAYCQEQHLTFTRSRPYRKNDQAWVEQKNGSVVRRLVGYGRLDGIAAASDLARLYAASRLFVNFFQPSFKLKSKTRVGAKVSKTYHRPETPYARLLAVPTLGEEFKTRLRTQASQLDPLRLLEVIRTMQERLVAHVAGQSVPGSSQEKTDLDDFLQSLATAWQGGEVRPTHRAEDKAPRHWRTRKDPFVDVWKLLVERLEEAPDLAAKELLSRLQRENGGEFPDTLLRTLQRRVHAWRTQRARTLLVGELDHVGAVAPASGDGTRSSGSKKKKL